MKYTVEITKDKIVKKFIDDEGKFSDELLRAIYDEDLGDIWREIRNS